MICKLLLAVLVVVLAFVGELLYSTNVFSTFETLNEEHCSFVHAERASGLEDGDVLGNVVLFSADGTRRAWMMTGEKGAAMKATSGDLFAYVDGALTKVKRSQEPDDFEFHPHGVGLLGTNVGAATRTRLFVINHRAIGEEVLVYNYDPATKSAELIDTVRDKVLFRHINDVTPISESEFLVTIWQYYDRGTLLHAIEQFGRRPWTYVARCVKRDFGWQCARVVDQLVGANGINKTPKKDMAIVVECTGSQVDVYSRTLAGALTLKHQIPLLGVPDNVHVTGDSRIFVTTHAKPLDFIKHADNGAHKSLTVVAELVGNLEGPTRQLSWRAWYVGDKLSGGSIAVLADNNTMLIGGVFDDGLLRCDMTKMKSRAI